MKRIITMKTMRNCGIGIVFGAAVVFALFACEQPFKAGLGPVVDTRPPTIAVEAPGAGSYIWGDYAFRGTAEDDYGLSKVEMMVTNHPDSDKTYLRDYTEVRLVKSANNKGDWNYMVDTSDFPDGDIKMRFKVTDLAGKTAETDEIAFYVKNQPPSISVSAPYIAMGTLEGDVGGMHLNYYSSRSPDDLPFSISYPRRMDGGGFISGSIRDDQDIYTGPVAGKKYPPQIRFWHVTDSTDPSDYKEVTDLGIKSYAPGVLPPEDDANVPWVTFSPDELFPLAVGNYQFAYSLPAGAGRFYGFEIRAQSSDERATPFHYPRSYFPNTINWDDTSTTDGIYGGDFKKENRYVLIYVSSRQTPPTADLIGLEDVLDPGKWNAANGTYDPIDNVTDNMSHPYVNKITVNKNGSFTLRVWASHLEGVKSAEVYWEKEGSTDRGRFIWDMADAAPANVSGWDDSSNVSADRPYSQWGYRDQKKAGRRNFIFTYDHGGNNRVPAGTGIHLQVKDQPKIQRYKLDDATWKDGKKGDTSVPGLMWSEFASFDSGMWEEYTLGEGVYHIEFYAVSTGGTKMTSPFTCTVRLDWEKPEAEIIMVDGAYGEDIEGLFPPVDGSAIVVNGAIQPRLRFSDSRPEDSGLRTAVESYYLRPGTVSNYGFEQRYILVDDADKTAVDTAIAAGGLNWWPAVPASAANPLAIDGIAARKHGPVFDSRVLFKTSKIYAADTDVLPDGDYWLYLFVRDNAFNVKHITQKIAIREASDIPRFNFSIGEMTEEVTKPNAADDHPNSGAAEGFWVQGSVNARNVLGANQDIRLKISDDDSLDLGVEAGAASGITISFTGTKYNPDGTILEGTPIVFNDTQVKEVFGFQTLDAQSARRAVLERTGIIRQEALYNMLKANSAYNYLFAEGDTIGRLPDGTYKIEIVIKDHRPAKLKMAAGDADPDVADNSVTFWIAVDSNSPKTIGTVEPLTNGYTSRAELADGVRATVSDRNGPLTITYAVTDSAGTVQGAATGIIYTDGTADLLDQASPADAAALANGMWQVSFRAPVAIPAVSASNTYSVTITVKDRFGKTAIIGQKYMLDETPPDITLRRPIETVDRSGFDSALIARNGLGGIPPADLNHLANGTVSFIISATDNLAVKELRWWLLPFGEILPIGAGQPPPAWDYVPSSNARFGSLDRNFTSTVFRINTVGMNGVYNLHAMAVDNSGMYTNVPLQTIYIAPASDIPFFGLINPDNVSVGSTIVAGTIFEDDGFMDSGGNIRAGTIRMWVSTNSNANLVDLDSDPSGTYGYGAAVTIPLTTPARPGTPNIRPLGSKNIGLNVDLAEYFSSMFIDAGSRKIEGRKHYIIEATDSEQGKFDIDGNTVLETKTRRFYYSFMYDTLPPQIDLTYPPQNQTYSGASSISAFALQGWMMDANLDRLADSSYYLSYRFNDVLTGTNFPLLPGEITAYSAGQTVPGTNPANPPVVVGSGETAVVFNIPSVRANAILNAVNPSTGKSYLLNGNNTLWLTARDQSGKEETVSLKFFIDIDGPEIFLDESEVVLNEISSTVTDWWPQLPLATNQAWYTNRKNMLAGKNVPVIQYRSGEIPVLTGFFEDESSNVDRASMRYSFDNGGTWLANGTVIGTSKNVRWSVNLTNNGTTGGDILCDGLHSISIKISDENGNETASGMYAFRINSLPPSVSIASSVNDVFGSKADPVFTISGTAVSANMGKVHLTVRHTENSKIAGYTPFTATATESLWSFTSPDDPPQNPPKVITENLAWLLDINLANIITAGGTASLEEGVYEIAVTSVDLGNIESNEELWQFTIDLSSPEFEFTGLVKNAGEIKPVDLLSTPLQQKTLMSQNPRVQGRVTDSWSDLTVVQRQIRQYDYVTDSWKYYNFTSNVFAADDDPGKAVYWNDVPGATGSRDGRLDWDLKGSITSLEDGFYAIKLRAKDSARTGADTSWAATANGNPKESPWLYFFYSFIPPDIENDPGARIFSSAIHSDHMELDVKVTDANRFDTLAVKVEAISVTAPTINLTPPVDGKGEKSGIWEPTVSIPFIPVASYPDGNYRITFTAANMAGRTTSITRNITLDNQKPSGKVDEPRFIGEIYNVDNASELLYKYAGETKYGGESLTISGTTDDVSGVAELWFHLGYGYNNMTSTSFPDPEVLGAYFVNGVPNANSAWFKYQDGTVPLPNFNPIPTNSGDYPYTWSLTMNSTAITAYALPITVKGTPYKAYDSASGPWMIQKIDDTKIPTILRKDGLYSLPLTIRIVDGAGNINYIQRDIWIYPNGDFPGTSIFNPSAETAGEDAPRGGMLSVEGLASDNRSVQSVIYRVTGDNVSGPNWNTTGPTTTQVIEPRGATPLSSADPEWPVLSAKLSGDTNGWFRADMESIIAAPEMPWNFWINRNGEVDAVIGASGWGFNINTSRYIRIYVEVYVIDGAEAGGGVGAGGNYDSRLISVTPIKRIFYMRDSSPSIESQRISSVGVNLTSANIANAGNYIPYSSTAVRSKKFAVRAALNGGSGAKISQVSVRLPREQYTDGSSSFDNTGWKTVYGTGAETVPGLTLDSADAYSTADLIYAFDSSAVADAGFAHVLGGTQANGGARYAIDFRIRDNNDPPSEASYRFEIGIDNFAPVADEVRMLTPGKAAGTSVSFMGRNFDYEGLRIGPPYRSIEKVYAWFTKGTDSNLRYINLHDAAAHTVAGVTPAGMSSISAMTGREATIGYGSGASAEVVVDGIEIDETGTARSIAYPTPGTGDISTSWVKVISEREAGVMTNRMMWQPSGTSNDDIFWSFITDTTVLPDGWITLNYLVIDSAGNASYYKQRTVIMNKYPALDIITLYTDNIGEGAAFTTHVGSEAYSSYPVTTQALGYINSGFISKNTVIGFGINTLFGNAPLNYRVEYVKREKVPLDTTNLIKMANERWGNAGGWGDAADGNVYTIDTTKGIDRFAWATLGVHSGDPAIGENFVFNATLEDIGTGTEAMGYPNASVWRYTRVRAVNPIVTGVNNQGDPVTDPNQAIEPRQLFFSDHPTDKAADNGRTWDYFNGTGIRQFQGSQPDAPDKPNSPLPGVVYNDRDDTAFFLIKVWDTVNDIRYGTIGHNEYDMLADAVVVGMNVFLSDSTPPKARLYDLNPYTETRVTGNNINLTGGDDNKAATRANAADPTAIGQNILRGGLYNTGTERAVIKSGYIDPRTGSTSVRPWIKNAHAQWVQEWADNSAKGDVGGASVDMVSGKIILRGQVWDDQLIDEIWIKIGNDAEKRILKLDPPIDIALAAGQNRAMKAVGTAEAFAYEELHWKMGHTIEWAYVWDTEREPSTGRTEGIPVINQPIWVRAVDIHGQVITGGVLGGTKGLSSTQRLNAAGDTEAVPGTGYYSTTDETGTYTSSRPTDSTTFHNTIAVNIVPYITGFERETPKFVTKRSLQGWYSFYQGEPNISVMGYNLGINQTDNTTTGITMTLNSGAVTVNTTRFYHEASQRYLYRFAVPTAGTSGTIQLTVTGAAGTAGQDYNRSIAVPVIATRSWNSEYSANTPGSKLWVNMPYAHILRTTGNTGTPNMSFTGSTGLDSPSMSLQYTNATDSGTLHGAWSNYSQAGFYYGASGSTSVAARVLGRYAEPFSHTDIDYFNTGTASSNNNGSVVVSYQYDGQATLRFKSTIAAGTTDTGTLAIPAGTYPELGGATNPSATDRWQNSRVRKTAASSSATNAGRLFVTSYDSVNTRLFFTTRTNASTAYYLDGGGTAGTGVGANIANSNTAGTIARSDRAGKWSAIDYDTNGYPVVAYYDETNDTLRLAYAANNEPNPGTANNWTRRYVLPVGHALRNGSGTYVSMKIDTTNISAADVADGFGTLGENKIHLAFFNSNKNIVVYAVGSRTGSFKAYAIDRVVQGGAWTDISVDSNGNPYIVYADSTRTGERDGIRIAYKGAFARTLEDPVVPNQYITGWEALTMPADYTINNDRLNIEAWPPINRGGTLNTDNHTGNNNWQAAIGYASDMFRLAYFYRPAPPAGF